jgi:hypothetical protein
MPILVVAPRGKWVWGGEGVIMYADLGLSSLSRLAHLFYFTYYFTTFEV